MNSHKNPVRLEDPSQFGTNGESALSQTATDETSIVPGDAPILSLPADATAPGSAKKPARWVLLVIAVGLVFSLAWSLGLAWLAGFLLGVW
jgi:hypothetical protein